MEEKLTVELYTDGACSGNPGPGGYAGILRFTDKSGKLHEKEYSEGFPETTNNRMEVLAAITGLSLLTKPCVVELYSDSQYLVKTFNEGWIDGWILKDFRRGKRDEVKNIDLWEKLLLVMRPHTVHFHWVKGHDANELNNRCDRLAVEAYGKYTEAGTETGNETVGKV